jgi:SAM-dependent methyltransferase
MSLLARRSLVPLLSCPACRSAVEAQDSLLRCSNAQCRFGGDGAFPMASGQPVLVDFDRSILSEEDVLGSGGESPVDRGNPRSVRRSVTQALLPSNSVAADNARRLLALAKRDSGRPLLLIVGGASPGDGTAALYEDQAIDVIGFDIYASPLTQLIADAHRIPIADGCIDAVWIQAVLEHVLDPSAVVSELYRVLKPDGLVYAETPFMQQVHEGPYDFTRFTQSGHRWLFKRFEEIDSGPALGPAAQLVWSIDYFFRGLFRSVKAGGAAKLMFFWLKYFDRLLDRRHAIDGASAVFFLGRKSDRELRPRDMVAYYKGADRRG